MKLTVLTLLPVCFETECQVALAGLRTHLAKDALELLISLYIHLPRVRIRACPTTPSSFGAKDQTQGFVHAS